MPNQACNPKHRSDQVVVAALQELWVITLDDIKSHWMDLMVKRLFAELNRQLLQIENQKAEESRGNRVESARVLASLEHTLEKLARLEAERDAVRKSEGRNADAMQKKLDRRFRRVAAGGEAKRIPGKSEQ